MKRLFLCLSLLYTPALLQAKNEDLETAKTTTSEEITTKENEKAEGTYFGDDSVSTKSKIKTGARLAAYGTAGVAAFAGGAVATVLAFPIVGPLAILLGGLVGESIFVIPLVTGITPLEIAITDDNITKVKKLLLKNPKLAGLTYNGRLPLTFATLKNTDLDIIKHLVEAYPNALKIKDDQGNFPIVYAIKNKYSNSTAAFKKFVGLKHNDQDNHEVFQYLLDKDPSCINVTFDRNAKFSEKDVTIKNTLFYKAALSDDPYYLQALLKVNPKGAMSKNINGVLPLHLAAARGNKEIVKILLKAYPEAVKAKTKDGKTPAQLAANDDIKLMLGGGSKKEVSFMDRIKATVSSDTTILHTSARKGDETKIKKILNEDQTAAQKQDKDGNLPLHLAAMREDGEDAVKMLLKAYEKGAEIKNKQDKTPADVAATQEIKDLLLQALL